MLKRKAEKKINAWIESGSKALLVYGVRQAGKTYSIRQCLKESGCDYVEFNLLAQPDIVSLLDNSTSVADLILKLSLYSDKKIIPGHTYIFFDEIQKCKEIVTKIKFLVDDGRYKYVLSGSLLGVELTNLKSAPVGYLTTLKMYPLDFEEFIQIFNIDNKILQMLNDSFMKRIPVDEAIHKKMLDLFNMYLIIGGMPAAVEKYKTTENIDTVIDEHLSIIEQYKLDFTQYEAQNKKLILTNIYDLIPAELNSKNKRFKIADIDKGLRYERMIDSFTWLWKSGVALPVFNTTEPTLPLLINKKQTLFKLFLSDIGILTTIYGKATKLKIISNESSINNGAIYENVVAQELSTRGFSGYYYNNKKLGEVDFLIEYREQVLPIEVKSGKHYGRHSALLNVLKEKNYALKEALVLSNQNVKVKNSIIYMPIYMIMFLTNNDSGFTDISLDRFKI